MRFCVRAAHKALFITMAIAWLTAFGDGPARAAETYEYDYLTTGEVSGSQKVIVDADGITTIDFQYNDRGRGPSTRTRVELNKAGIPVAASISGKNYFKAAVGESFTWRDAIAVWHSSAETGERAQLVPSFYVPADMPPYYLGILARALLAAPGQSIDLLPSGRASIRRVKEISLVQGLVTKKLTLYEIDGLELLPAYVWLDEQHHFFGYERGWFAILPKNWSNHLAAIHSAQEESLNAFLYAQTRKLSNAVTGVISIRNAWIFNSKTGRREGPSNVLIKEGRIAEIRKPGKEGKADFVYDATGKTLLPGLWDMHAHIYPDSLVNYMASGVLNVRDMANNPESLSLIQQDIAAGRLMGPDIMPMGFIDKKGDYSAPTGRLATGLEEALQFVDEYKGLGYTGIKLYSSLDPDWVRPIAERAHSYGQKILGHIPSSMNAETAIGAGYDEITHLNMLLLQFLGNFSIDTRTPARFTYPGEHAGEIDLSSPAVKDFVGKMKEKGVAHDPTAAIILNMFRNKPGSLVPMARWFGDRLPAVLRRREIAGAGLNAGKEALYEQAADMVLKVLKLLHEKGVRILPGTDYHLPGFGLVSELMVYKEAGISDSDILKLATIEPARHMGVEDTLGSVEVGKKAHLLLVDGDPSSDISLLQNVDLVIKGQTYYRPHDLLAEQGIRLRGAAGRK